MAAHMKFKPARVLFLGLLAASAPLATPVLAQEQTGVIEPTQIGGAQSARARHLAEMVNYETAVAAGDFKAAELHAYAAWRAAETELGDHRLTSVLAFNYGREVVANDPALAEGALQRAKTLFDAGFGGPDAGALNLYLAYSDFVSGGGKSNDADKLREALVISETSSDRRMRDEIIMWLAVARSDLNEEDYELAQAAAAKAESTIVIFEPDSSHKLAEAFFIRGVASIMPKKRTLDDTLSAIDYFENGEELFPPQSSFENFDPTLANIVGWRTATDALIRTMTSDEEVLARLKSADETPLFQSAVGKPEICRIEWADRPAPKFPENALAKQKFGAVVAVFDLANDTSVHNPRILAEAPSDKFSPAVLKAMKSWRLKAPALDHPGCRKNMMTQFSFVVD